VPAKLRFMFWATEELVNAGSAFYVRSLSAADRQAIRIYINAEMIGSANSARFVARGEGVVTAPFTAYFQKRGIPYEFIDVQQIGSDHEPFMASGIPVVMLHGGAMGVKSEPEALRYGGTPGQMYDPHYHQPHDTVDNMDLLAFDVNARAIAFAIGESCADPGLISDRDPA
jgi:Zn-dependent M28 family amino/carboxypeptidase